MSVNYVKCYEALCLGDKGDLSRATRFIYLELCLQARKNLTRVGADGAARIPLSAKGTDAQAVRKLIGGDAMEIVHAVKALTAGPDPMLRIVTIDGQRVCLITKWVSWNSHAVTPPPRSDAGYLAARSTLAQGQLHSSSGLAQVQLGASSELAQKNNEQSCAVVEKANLTSGDQIRSEEIREEKKERSSVTLSGDLPPLGKKPRKPKAAIPAASATVAAAFDHWRNVMGSPKAVLDAKRQSAIDWALKSYTIEDVKLAIDGCRADDWSMGENDRGNKYNDVTVIFRDAGHVEKFMALAPATSTASTYTPPPPSPMRPEVAAQKVSATGPGALAGLLAGFGTGGR
jgi:hypothetical protein